ncbi:MAG: helix-turn-helix domain-containing protein [Chloroflexota bacterium]|nr:helix-turn-helix domain-containing protein [Chloroflexota bacterium]MDP9359736.1 helix-turn-helix domain-containing protein [Chloroflexota bacterium]MDP9470225.1 helix-turn-helix domain-containing protein [Chloroflexota bacterium]
MRTLSPDRQTLTIEEVAAALGIDRSTAYALAKADRLPAPVIRLGRRMVVGRAALERALAGETARRAGTGDGAA